MSDSSVYTPRLTDIKSNTDSVGAQNYVDHHMSPDNLERLQQRNKEKRDNTFNKWEQVINNNIDNGTLIEINSPNPLKRRFQIPNVKSTEEATDFLKIIQDELGLNGGIGIGRSGGVYTIDIPKRTQ